MKKYLLKNRKSILSVALVIAVSFFLGNFALANWATDIVGGLMQVIISMLGKLLIFLMEGLISVASYSNFIKSEAVTKGWVIVRDISNMFFVAVMLVIAFSTVLGIEKYNYKKALPKLIIMAVLINFSKTICGLLIDVSQVVMLTFVNAFKDMAGYNLTEMLGVSNWQNLTEGDSALLEWQIVGAYFLAVIYALISIVVVAAMIMMLIMRIVMIWIYVALSPLAYLTAAFPGGEKYSSQWWSEFTKNLIVGPVLAFFIWLSFTTVSIDSQEAVNNASNISYDSSIVTDSTSSAQDQAANEMAGGELLIKFLISIGMLLGGLQITQSIGGAAGGMAGKGMSKIQKGAAFATGAGASALAFARKKTVDAGKKTAAFAGSSLKTGAGFIDRKLGDAAGKLTGNRTSNELRNAGLIGYTTGQIGSSFGKASTGLKRWMRQDDSLDQARRQYFEEKQLQGDNAVMKYEGSKYKAGAGGKMYKVNEDGSMSNEVLAVNRGKAKKEIKEMGATSAAFYDSKRSSFSRSRAVSDAKEVEKVEKEKKDILARDVNFDEMRQKMNNRSTSESERMAYASILGEKGKFKDANDIETARKLLSGNGTLSDTLNSNIDKKQAHLAYDLKLDDDGNFTNKGDYETFSKKIDKGDIDPTKLDADAYSNSGLVKALKNYYGRDFPRVMESAFKRGKKYEESVAKGLLATREKGADGHIKEDDASSQLHAKLTGDVQKSFNVELAQGGSFDEAAMKKFFSGSAADLNKIDANKLKEIFNSNDSAKKAALDKVSYASLKSMYKQGSNPETVRLMREQIMQEANKAEQTRLSANPKKRGESIADYNSRMSKDMSPIEEKAKKIATDRELRDY